MTVDEPAADRVRSLRSFDAASGTWRVASVDELAALIRADVSPSSPAPFAGGVPWKIELTIDEVVGVLRCLDELAAVYAGSALEVVVSGWSGELRRRAEAKRGAASNAPIGVAGTRGGSVRGPCG